MKWLKTAALAAAICIVGSTTLAASLPTGSMYRVIPATRHITVPGAPTVSPLPRFTYNVTDPLSHTKYSGAILGSAPATLTATALPVQIVPLKVTLNDGATTVTYDPTVPDPCSGNRAPTQVVAQSPLFAKNVKWTMNGVWVGWTQYIDAFQRAQFWGVVHGSNYHLLFNRTQLPKQHATFGPSQTSNQHGFWCGEEGQTPMSAVRTAVENIITGPLQGTINVGTLPVFLCTMCSWSTGEPSWDTTAGFM